MQSSGLQVLYLPSCCDTCSCDEITYLNCAGTRGLVTEHPDCTFWSHAHGQPPHSSLVAWCCWQLGQTSWETGPIMYIYWV